MWFVPMGALCPYSKGMQGDAACRRASSASSLFHSVDTCSRLDNCLWIVWSAMHKQGYLSHEGVAQRGAHRDALHTALHKLHGARGLVSKHCPRPQQRARQLPPRVAVCIQDLRVPRLVPAN